MINYPDNFKNSVASDFDGLFNWDYLEGVFPRGIMPMDWDGVVEINNNFLVFETKDLEREVPKGQLMALSRASKVGPFIILIIWGKEDPVFCQVIYKGYIKNKENCNKESIKSFCSRWTNWANNKEKLSDEILSDEELDEIGNLL